MGSGFTFQHFWGNIFVVRLLSWSGKDREYDCKLSALEGKRELNAEESARLERFLEKVVGMFHPDLHERDPAKGGNSRVKCGSEVVALLAVNHGRAAISISALGRFLAICNRRTAAPEGERRPRSHEMAVVLGTLRRSANTAWLTFKFLRIAAISSPERASARAVR